MKQALSLLLLLLLLPSSFVASSACQFDYDVDCNNPYSANAWVTFVEPNYDASVVFHWGQEDTDFGPQTYDSSTSPWVGDFFDFGTKGEFTVGATVTFGEGSDCNGQSISRNQTIWFEESACGLGGGDDEGTNIPTTSPMGKPTPRPTPGEIDTTADPTPSEMDVSILIIFSRTPQHSSSMCTQLITFSFDIIFHTVSRTALQNLLLKRRRLV